HPEMSAPCPLSGVKRTWLGERVMSASDRLCCKSIFGIWSRNIDSRSDTNEQQRFKRTDAPIRLLQISISQSLLGDFCNTIDPKRTERGSKPGMARAPSAYRVLWFWRAWGSAAPPASIQNVARHRHVASTYRGFRRQYLQHRDPCPGDDSRGPGGTHRGCKED